MKMALKVLTIVGLSQTLVGCFAGGALAGAVGGTLLQNTMLAKQAESKPPKYIEISQQGRIITASFEVKGFAGTIGHGKRAQVQGFHEWATASVVREASKRGCVNVVNAFSASQGARISGSSISNKLQFKCLEKETVMSEQDLLEDKKVLYAQQIQYIEEHPEMIVYK